MLSDSLNGYQSPSQFSREFKRLFDVTPKQALREMREALPEVLAQEVSAG